LPQVVDTGIGAARPDGEPEGLLLARYPAAG
jgi:hypothetical protein